MCIFLHVKFQFIDLMIIFEKFLPINPGKKNPLSVIRTISYESQPCFFVAVTTSLPALSMNSIFPSSSTPITPFWQISRSCKDFECTKGPMYAVRFGVIVQGNVSIVGIVSFSSIFRGNKFNLGGSQRTYMLINICAEVLG